MLAVSNRQKLTNSERMESPFDRVQTKKGKAATTIRPRKIEIKIVCGV